LLTYLLNVMYLHYIHPPPRHVYILTGLVQNLGSNHGMAGVVASP